MNTKSQKTAVKLGKNAHSSAKDYEKVLADLGGQLERAKADLSALEDARKSVILNGEDIDIYHERIFKTAEKVKTLQAGLDEARRQQQKALAEEHERALMAEAKRAQEEFAPAYEKALRQFYEAMGDLVQASEQVANARRLIEGTNEFVIRNERHDLKVSIAHVRSSVTEALKSPSSTSDPKVAPIERMEGETDQAFILRRSNAEAAASRRNQLEDPIRSCGEKAMLAIQAHALEMGAHERARNYRMIATQAVFGPYAPAGHTIEKNVDPTLGDPSRRATHTDIVENSQGNGTYRGVPSSNA